MDVIDLDGRQLATWDRGEGTPVLFIHGVGTPGSLWQADLADQNDGRAHRIGLRVDG